MKTQGYYVIGLEKIRDALIEDLAELENQETLNGYLATRLMAVEELVSNALNAAADG